MAARKKKSPQGRQTPGQPTRAQRHWGTLLLTGLPLLDMLAFSTLERDLRAGDPHAATLLAIGLDMAQSQKLRLAIRAALEKVTQTACINALWGEAFRSRSNALLGVLLKLKQPASAPPEARAFSLLHLKRLQQLEDAPPELVMPLIQACEDHDPNIAAGARQVIGHLQKEDALDILCAHWARTRGQFLEKTILDAGYLAHNPVDVRVLTALKLNQPEQIDAGSMEVVAPLIQASRDADREIAARAGYLLRHALTGAALTEFCLRWSQTRDEQLATILMQSSLLPHQPQPLRLLCALKLGHQEIVQKCPPRNLDILLSACRDADPAIISNARLALRNLQSPESREALCQLFIAGGDEEAGQAALEAGYLPASGDQRALFLFLNAQWQAYETLDFDQRILRAIYDTAPAELRQRLARTVQSAGRIEFLSILTGVDYRQRAARMDDAEAGMVIQMLLAGRNWEKIWLLAQELPLARSVEILRMLSSNGWAPQQPDEKGLFEQLAKLAGLAMVTSPGEITRLLPPAVPLATLKVRGRVNDVAFAPGRTELALATGSRKVVLWDYQKAQVTRMLVGFDHSVGQVAYLPDGQLVCAERTNGPAECAVLGFDGQQYYRIGAHSASVTALIPLSGGNLLTAGRDRRVVLWNAGGRYAVGESSIAEWPRCAAVSADERLAALLSDRLLLLELPDLSPLTDLPQIQNSQTRVHTSVARCGAFSPDGADLLVGQLNGEVARYLRVNSIERRQRQCLATHRDGVVGIGFRPGHPLAITASSDGELRFIDWPAGKEKSHITAPLPGLTSLEISGDGDFMATGSGENAFVLWDLRTQDLPHVMGLPLAGFQPEHLAAVESLVQVKEIPAPVRNALCYLEALLQHRYRFDIQITEVHHIQPGAFDILVDDSIENNGYNG